MTSHFQTGHHATELFYHLLDLEHNEQQQLLAQIQGQQPGLFHEVSALLNSEAADPFTDLLTFHARQATEDELDFSNQSIDKYQLRHELGRGGIAIVYAARRADETFEQDLAIKFIQPSLSRVLGKRALFEEAQLLARLSHPYIAKIFDGGIHQDSVYIVMEQIEGRTLNQYLQDTHLTPTSKLQLLSKICQAIEHAHQNQVLHADLTPDNILIDREQNPKLLDFNLTQKVSGTPASADHPCIAYSEKYASPEQKAGAFLTQQSDLYSLGKILLWMFPQERSHSDIHLIGRKATEPEAAQRYSSVSELRHDIEHVLAYRPISLKLHAPLYSVQRLIQRRPVPTFLLTLLILAGIFFTSTLISKNRQLAQEKMIAEEMMYEVTSLMFHSKAAETKHLSVNTMLELTRRRILSNPEIPKHIKQKILLAMITPIPEKHNISPGCQFVQGGCQTQSDPEGVTQ
ncbi:serine/threonine protein kinase [Photobacterium sp. TY1-4]|uniref:serine/threonine protein kinase n=1 Tax=Photobacterium sp. TY1-4 TaxID=2899122 RepID=UPI0021C22B31|nr:serine/threonine-protein kinase [Photobacterium sp. TY1-4]UXI01347.1 serine/threonine protein kinase [Photobacterium sp. TY1-4]